MAPVAKGRPQDASLPLADYFWIAGLDGQQLLEAYKPLRWSYEQNESLNSAGDHSTDDVIREDVDAEQEATGGVSSPRNHAHHARKDSYQRLSQLSGEARDTILGLETNSYTRSNRSSATIRAVPPTNPRMSTFISDQDFEMAIQKFTVDRESFFLDLNFSSAATARPKRAKSRPRTQRIVPEDSSAMPNRGFGSVRRHLSFKEMSSSRRQSSMARRVSSRTSRRISSYNSVVPNPEPLRISPDQHPLKRKFDPVLLDRYPRSTMVDELSKRNPFPEYVPMFAFPNDIRVVSSDARPRSTWHEFSMTAADNSKVPAVCVIVYVPMNRQTADELEKRCEEWRRDNMSEAERELAASLAERLALERAKLSRLLAQLPQASSGSDARDELEDEIGIVEERIAVMSDMLKPLRHGAASKIEGLTDGDTGLWVPRAYGILGRGAHSAFWKQWLRAVVVPMLGGTILRVPPSSPKIGMWQPLEKYVRHLCVDAPSPIASKIQVDFAIRELHLYAKKEAVNELPGSRTTDLYPLFRALTIPNIVVLLEYVLSEARIILLSSHTAMLQLVSRAILELIWPMQWAGVYIPVLPSRLIQALEAPCPYICGIQRNYEKYDLPEDDFVLVDLDANELQSTAHPPALPKQQRRKLMSLLHLAAPHHHSFGVPPGPPAYTMETFPFDAFSGEHEPVFTGIVRTTNLSRLVSLSSSMFGVQAAADTIRRAPILNAFISSGATRGKSMDRPSTATTARRSSRHESEWLSPINTSLPPPPMTPVSRNDSGYALQTSLREKRSGHFDSFSRRNESLSGFTGPLRRKASQPFSKHGPSPSNASMAPDASFGGSTYAPSTYAQSTLAASTIMPGLVVQPARNTDTTSWIEGHCLQWRPTDGPSTCVLCDEKAQDGFYRCSGCGFVVHGRCAEEITVVCPSAFYPDQVRAAFARLFASLFYTYRKFLGAASEQRRKNGMTFQFNMDAFIHSLPPENAAYIEVLRQTQAFNEFIGEREHVSQPPSPSIALFDAIVLAKRNRTGRFAGMQNLALSRNPFSSRLATGATTDLLSDTSAHQWRIVPAPSSSERPELGAAAKGRDYHTIVTRAPAKLEDDLLSAEKIEPVPQLPKLNGHKKKSTLKDRMNGLGMNAP